LKALDDLVTGPDVLMLLGGATIITIAHSIWLLIAQGKWKRTWRSHARQSLKASHLRQRHADAEERSRLEAALAFPEEGSDSAANREFEQEEKVSAPIEFAGQGTAPLGTLSSSPAQVDDSQTELWRPWVDIFISAKNESRVIEQTVRNFFKLDYDRFLLWVIDDCSTDSMPQVLERLQSEFTRLRVVNRPSKSYPGKSAALNEALPLAKGEVIAVFDADAYVAPNFFDLMLPVLQPDHIGAVQAQKKIYTHQHTNYLCSCQASEYALDTYFQMGRDLIGGAVELRGNGQMVKRAALIDVGGWNNKSITDDLDLSMRLLINNWDIRFCPYAHVWEEGVTTIKGWMRQRRRWAEGSIRRYLDYIFPLNSPTRLSLVERIDTLAFTVYFVVPALLLIQTSSEIVTLLMGLPFADGKLFFFLTLAVFVITQFDVAVAVKIYRDKQMSILRAIWHSFVVTAYIYGFWVPVITVAFCQILFGKSTSTWHPTEHGKHQLAGQQ
jgi:1,2-diacylglycerol 3-beta-glucosyltransferase